MSGFQINPPRAPMVDAQGNCTPEWYRYFAAVQRVIGGPSDPFDDGLLSVNATAVDLRGDDPSPYTASPAMLAPDEALPPAPSVPRQEDILPPLPVVNYPVEDFLFPPRFGA